MLSRLRPIWPLLTALASGVMLAAAHAFQRFGGLEPCALCLDQRNWHWGVVAASLASLAALRLRGDLARWLALGIGAVLLGSGVQAAFHVAVEQHWVIYRCEASGDFGNLAFDDNAPLVAPQCDQVAWSLLGVSMAGYNAAISFLLALASFAVALAPARKP